jgi:glycerol-3-phosphate dehydrogenase
VRYCCDEEWGETLADLVERRLLLVFDPDLTVTTLRAIAAELVTEGRLGAESVDGEIATLVALMADRYGKRLVD